MISAYLKPIILVFSPGKTKYEMLSLSPDSLSLPKIEVVANSTPTDLLNHLLDQHLVNNIASLNKSKLTDIEIVDNSLNIYYIVFVGYETELRNSHLTSIDLTNAAQLTPTTKQLLSLLV